MSLGDPRGGGGRLMLGFHGTTPSKELERVLLRTGARAILLFARNIEDAAQCRRLIEDIRGLVPWPLAVAVDQEGGAVARILRGATVFPGNLALGAVGDVDLARSQGRCSGQQLAALGFDINLAPVVDLQTNPKNPVLGIRSLGADRERATMLARALIEGHAETGVLSCIKHFPGLGAASVDPHLDLHAIPLDREALEEPHLRIFAELLAAGLRTAVMTTHVVLPALDAEQPATFSSRIVRDLLRGRMGHDGLVIADDMEMGAILRHHPGPGAALRAAQAGHDLIPVCHSAESQLGAAELLCAALDSGELDVAEHERSLARIDASLVRERPALPVDPKPGDQIAASIARRAVHCFGDARGLLPLARGTEPLVLSPWPPGGPEGLEPRAHDWRRLLASLFGGSADCRIECFAHEAAAGEARRVLGLAAARHASERGPVVLLTWKLRESVVQQELLEALSARLPERLVVAHLQSPFDQALVPAGITALTAFGYRIVQLEALVDALFGRLPCNAVLPAPIR